MAGMCESGDQNGFWSARYHLVTGGKNGSIWSGDTNPKVRVGVFDLVS